jgi:hypothetical protein
MALNARKVRSLSDPFPYATSKSSLLMMTSRETIKIKMPEGDSKQAILGDGADVEEYVKHLMCFEYGRHLASPDAVTSQAKF